MAEGLAGHPGVEVLNEVVLNQVLVRFTRTPPGDADGHTREVIRRVQEDGIAWLGGTTWHGQAAMRISVGNWSTTEADADATVEAILRAHLAAPGRRSRTAAEGDDRRRRPRPPAHVDSRGRASASEGG
jgi:glutamate/tyrosine decarboxylase-like PLP-dependent enzyme